MCTIYLQRKDARASAIVDDCAQAISAVMRVSGRTLSKGIKLVEVAFKVAKFGNPINPLEWGPFDWAIQVTALLCVWMRSGILTIGHSGSDGTFFSYLGWLLQRDIFNYIVGNTGQNNVKPIVSTVLKAALAMTDAKPPR